MLTAVSRKSALPGNRCTRSIHPLVLTSAGSDGALHAALSATTHVRRRVPWARVVVRRKMRGRIARRGRRIPTTLKRGRDLAEHNRARRNPRTARSRRPFRTPGQAVEPQDETLHLRPAGRGPYYRP